MTLAAKTDIYELSNHPNLPEADTPGSTGASDLESKALQILPSADVMSANLRCSDVDQAPSGLPSCPGIKQTTPH
jgi:hypothetical protein